MMLNSENAWTSYMEAVEAMTTDSGQFRSKMGEWMDGRTDGRTDGRMAGWMDGRTGGWMDEWMDGWTDGRMGGWWMGGWVDETLERTKRWKA